MEDIAKLAAQYGFPMVVAAYLLVRLDSRIESLTDAVNNLADLVRGGAKVG